MTPSPVVRGPHRPRSFTYEIDRNATPPGSNTNVFFDATAP